MKINYIGNDIKTTEAIADYVEKRLEKIEKSKLLIVDESLKY